MFRYLIKSYCKSLIKTKKKTADFKLEPSLHNSYLYLCVHQLNWYLAFAISLKHFFAHDRALEVLIILCVNYLNYLVQ